MKVPYTYLEVEYIDNEYDQQIPAQIIAENVNRDFHNGKNVRSQNSIRYVINKINIDVEWYEKLEEKWLSKVS